MLYEGGERLNKSKCASQRWVVFFFSLSPILLDSGVERLIATSYAGKGPLQGVEREKIKGLFSPYLPLLDVES